MLASPVQLVAKYPAPIIDPIIKLPTPPTSPIVSSGIASGIGFVPLIITSSLVFVAYMVLKTK
jgi:hypothetical protein